VSIRGKVYVRGVRIHHAYVGASLVGVGLLGAVPGIEIAGLIVFLDDLQLHVRGWARGRRKP
jgi:hypothetical protein